MKKIFETKRWICWIENNSQMCNGNGVKDYRLVIRKIIGNGDTGVRSINNISKIN